MKLPRCKLWGFYWWAVLGPNHFCWSETEPRRKPLVWGLQEDSGWLLCWNQDCLPRIKFLKSLVALLICLLQQKKKNHVCEISASHLQQKFIISYISIDAINCFHVFWSQFKVKHLEGKKNHITFPTRRWPPPGNWRTFQLDGDNRGDREAVSVLSFQVNKPGTLCWVLTSPSHTSFSVHLTNITVHQSFIFLSESLQTEKKCTKIPFCLWKLLPQYLHLNKH